MSRTPAEQAIHTTLAQLLVDHGTHLTNHQLSALDNAMEAFE